MFISSISTPINWELPHQRQKFGGRVQKISLHAEMTCPNRDGAKGWGGCTFCNNQAFAPNTRNHPQSIQEQIHRGIESGKRKHKNIKGFVAYFQAYTNTYAPLEKLKTIYGQALENPEITGIAIGTRPDCLEEPVLKYLAEINLHHQVVIELGIESVFDETLAKVNRGHDFACTVSAIQQCYHYGLPVVAHLMLGFPWESFEQGIQSAKILSSLPIEALKVHQLQVLKYTQMGHDYLKDPFKVLSKIEYFELMASFLSNLNPRIKIQRLFAQSPPGLMISERWPESIGTLNYELENFMRTKYFLQGQRWVGRKHE